MEGWERAHKDKAQRMRPWLHSAAGPDGGWFLWMVEKPQLDSTLAARDASAGGAHSGCLMMVVHATATSRQEGGSPPPLFHLSQATSL